MLPFHTLKHNNKVIEAITGGITPERPSEGEERVRDFDFLWKLCEQCWARNPTDRPTMEKNLDRLEVCLCVALKSNNYSDKTCCREEG